jgi:hypothetical protein
MFPVSIAALAVCVLGVMSIRANGRFKNEDRLPMQWSLDRSVNWTAPRRVALAFTPVLAAIVLSATVALTIYSTPRPGQGGLEIPAMVFVALVFIGAHAFHLWLIGNSLRRNG